MATQLEAIITFIGYMLPACMVVALIIGVVAWSSRLTKKSLKQVDEFVQLSRDIKHLLEESVTLQKENNRLLSQQQESRRGP